MRVKGINSKLSSDEKGHYEMDICVEVQGRSMWPHHGWQIVCLLFFRVESLFKPTSMMSSACHDDKYYRDLYPSIIADIEVSIYLP